MAIELLDTVMDSIKAAAAKLTGWKRREFQAETAIKFCDGSARKAEQRFGWGRDAVATGLGELRTGIRCLDNVQARGRKKAEEQSAELAEAIKQVAEPQTQADPKFQSTLAYTRVTAKAVRQEVAQTGISNVPSERSMHRILNRMGYSTKKVLKAKPQKKFLKQTPSLPT